MPSRFLCANEIGETRFLMGCNSSCVDEPENGFLDGSLFVRESNVVYNAVNSVRPFIQERS